MGICTERNREAALLHRQTLSTSPQAVRPSLVSSSLEDFFTRELQNELVF